MTTEPTEAAISTIEGGFGIVRHQLEAAADTLRQSSPDLARYLGHVLRVLDVLESEVASRRSDLMETPP